MDKLNKKILNINRTFKIIFLLLIDVILSSISIWITFNLISEKVVKFFEIDFYIYFIFSFTFVVIQIVFKSYLKLSRYFDFSSIIALIKNFIYFFIVLLFYKIVIYKGALIPSANLIIYLIIFFLFVLLKNSLLYNFYNYLYNKNNIRPKKVILYGFNEKTQNFLKNSNNQNFKVEGIINENLNFYKTTNNNFKLINLSEFNLFYKKNSISDILVTDKNNYFNKIKYFRKFLKYNVRVIFLSDVYNYINLENKFTTFTPRYDEVIGENFNSLVKESSTYKQLKNKIILVAGGAGSIGSILAQRLIDYKPNKIIVIDKDEYSIFNLRKKLSYKKNIDFKLIDTTQYKFLNKIFEKYKPDYVFNAAAYKHVDIVEENLSFSLYNNIKTSLNICELSVKHNVKKCLLVSTDKAVNPSNIMGLSKRLCEKIYLDFSRKKAGIFLIVRFGNVVGSKGSVIPYFQNLIEKKLPLPLTNKKATRFLMSISEACELIIKISIFGMNSGIYLLDMGKPINIYEMTYKLIKLNGLSVKNKKNPSGDIEIKYTGLKKGEKLHETLSYNSNLKNTKFKKILICNENLKSKLNLSEIKNFIKNLDKINNLKDLKSKLNEINY